MSEPAEEMYLFVQEYVCSVVANTHTCQAAGYENTDTIEVSLFGVSMFVVLQGTNKFRQTHS